MAADFNNPKTEDNSGSSIRKQQLQNVMGARNHKSIQNSANAQSPVTLHKNLVAGNGGNNLQTNLQIQNQINPANGRPLSSSNPVSTTGNITIQRGRKERALQNA